MAQNKKKVADAPPKSVADIRNFQTEFSSKNEYFAKVKDALRYLDLTKTEKRTYSSFSKDKLRTYMQNPKSNENNLRNLSRFLYRVSQSYRRLINYNAQQVDLKSMIVSPKIDITQDNNKEAVLKDYYDTCVLLEKMNLSTEMYKMLIIAWREDTAFGYIYTDDKDFMIMPLDGDYCKVSSSNFDGTLNFAFDFSYFKKHEECLEYWDSEFKKKYDAYQKDTSLRWQELDPEKTICLKVNIDDPTLSLPPYCGLFEAIIDNVDLQSIIAVKDELSIYKLLVARLQPLDNSDTPDNFEVDIDTAIDYYNKFEESLPAGVASTISPMPIEAVEFKGTSTDDNDMLANSTSNLFKISGGSLVLNDEHTGATIFRAHIISDMMQALKPLLGEIEAWTNRYLSYNLNNPSKVSYIETSPWMKNEKRKEIIESAQYGVPVKTALAALDGLSPLEMLSLEFLENDVLGLHDTWLPLNSSHTQSGKNSNTKNETELTDSGAETREKEKNK